MSQNVFSTINPATTSGTQLATLLVDFKNALMSGLSGTSRPSQLTQGGFWIDTTDIGSPNFLMKFKLYDGTADNLVFSVNISTGQIVLSGSADTYNLAHYSADTVAPIFSFIKRRVANNGQVLSGDSIGEQDYISRTDTSTDPIVASVSVVATQNHTASASGAYFLWKQIKNASASLVEVMRLINGKLGIGGVSSPEYAIHAKDSDGIGVDRETDDAVAAAMVVGKARLAGTGAVQTSDELGSWSTRAKDSTSAYAVVTKIKATALEGHTGSAKGASLTIQTIKTGASSLTDAVIVGDKIETSRTLKQNSLELVSQDVATTATITALSATKSIVNFTGSTATTIQGISSTGDTKVIVLHNNSSATITLSHENAGASATDRLKLPGSVDIVMSSNTSVELFYNSGDTRWKLKSTNPNSDLSAAIGTLAASKGGTGQSTYTAGDIVYASSSSALSKLNIGSDGQILKTNSGLLPEWASPASILPFVTQSDQETGTSTVTVVNPSKQHFHPSASKAWVNFDGTGGGATIRSSYNVASVTRNSLGTYTVAFTNAFSSATYAAQVTSGVTNSGNTPIVQISSLVAGSIQVQIVRRDTGGLDDSNLVTISCFGDL